MISARITPRGQFCRPADAAEDSAESDFRRRIEKSSPGRTPGELTRAPTDTDRTGLGDSWRTAADDAKNCGNHEQNDRDEKDDLGDLDREARNTAKPEHGCNQRDDEK